MIKHREERYLIRKGLAILVIILFIGLAFAPSINANTQQDTVEGELVEITTEVCGLPGIQSQTVKLTNEDAEAVDRLFEEIKVKLDAVESREETVDIFNEAIIELDKYGLLGDITIKQAQRLVAGWYQKSRLINFLVKMNRRPLEENENRFCLIAGKTDHTTVENYRIRFWIYLIRNFDSNELSELLYLIFTINMLFLQACPITLGGIIGFGLHRHIPYDIYYHVPAHGWICSIGLNGIKTWNGSFWGSLPINSIYDHPTQRWYPGLLHFNGINLINPEGSKHFIMGSALWIKLDLDN